MRVVWARRRGFRVEVVAHFTQMKPGKPPATFAPGPGAQMGPCMWAQIVVPRAIVLVWQPRCTMDDDNAFTDNSPR